MRMSSLSMARTVVAVALAATLGLAQGSACGTQLFVSNTGGNGQNGVMFDLVNTSATPLTICGFDVNLDPGTFPAQTWFVTAGGSHQPVASNAAAWTLASSGSVTSLGTSTTGAGNVLTPFPAISVTIAPGATQGFAVSLGSTATTLNYTTGAAATSVGAVFTSDANLQFVIGFGKAYLAASNGPFGGSFGSTTTGGRIANIRVGYTVAGGSPLWQINGPGSTFDVNGIATSSAFGLNFATATGVPCVPNAANISSTNVGLGWDLVIGGAVPVSSTGGGLTTPGGQILNISLADPTVSFLFGLTFAVPFANASLPFGAPVGFALSAQMVNLAPSNPDGFALSACTRFQQVAPPTSFTGPSGDDATVTLSLGGAPNCIPAIPFYGVLQTTMHVSTNGRVQLGGTANAAFTPSVVTAQSEGMVGCWTDMNTATNTPNGTITIDDSIAGIVSVNYANVGYFGQAGTLNTFQIVFDASTGVVTLANISGLGAQLVGSTLNMFTGISKGGGATDPGAAAFAPLSSGITGNGTDMLYLFATAPANGGCANIFFTPNAFGNYDWTSN